MDALTDIDHEILKYKWVAEVTARKLIRRHSYCHLEDLESACLWGVAVALRDFDPSRYKLRACLYFQAEKHGLNYVKHWRRKGFKFHCGRIPAGKMPEVVELETDSHRIFSDRPQHETWPDEDWKAILNVLPPKVARMFHMRFREHKETDEIAAELGCNVSNVRSSIIRHCKKLSETLR